MARPWAAGRAEPCLPQDGLSCAAHCVHHCSRAQLPAPHGVPPHRLWAVPGSQVGREGLARRVWGDQKYLGPRRALSDPTPPPPGATACAASPQGLRGPRGPWRSGAEPTLPCGAAKGRTRRGRLEHWDAPAGEGASHSAGVPVPPLQVGACAPSPRDHIPARWVRPPRSWFAFPRDRVASLRTFPPRPSTASRKRRATGQRPAALPPRSFSPPQSATWPS